MPFSPEKERERGKTRRESGEYRKYYAEVGRSRYEANREMYRSRRMENMYDITLEDFLKVCEAQNNRCAICGSEEKLVADHNHETGKFRGALCAMCNSGIGKLHDSIELLEKAIQYLKTKPSGLLAKETEDGR